MHALFTKGKLKLCLGAFCSALAVTLLAACNLESADGTTRTVGANVSGVYQYDADQCSNNGRFVSANSGNAVTYLDIRQTGDNLEAIDNNGIIFRGTIGDVFDTSVPFTLEGTTTAGKSVVISGTFNIGSVTILSATWIEDSLFGTVCGTSTGQTIDDSADTNTDDTTTDTGDTGTDTGTDTGDTGTTTNGTDTVLPPLPN